MYHAQAGANRRRPRHQRSAAHIQQAAAGNQIFGAIRQHLKAVFNQHIGGFYQLEYIRLQSVVVANQLQLNPIAFKHFARHLRGGNRFLHAQTTGGIGQNRQTQPLQQRPYALPMRTIHRPLAAQRHRKHGRLRRRHRLLQNV